MSAEDALQTKYHLFPSHLEDELQGVSFLFLQTRSSMRPLWFTE
jgi:hypothetical protein